MAEKIRSIGIFSHVDAGKTTITEQFLFLSGATKSAGDVNKGTTVTDHLDVERERGVSVRSADVSFMWKNHRINLVDTPGHADFASEVERALRVIDGAILVVSAVEGVQAHTYALWDALKNRKIPVIIFINKTDRQGANFGEVLKSLESELRLLTFPLFAPHREGEADASVIKIRRSVQDLVPGDFWEHAMENLAGLDEALLEAFLEERAIPEEEILEKLKDYTCRQKIFPVLCGVAKSGPGIGELLDAVTFFFPAQYTNSGKLSALVYRVRIDPVLGRLAHVRVFDGQISVRDQIMNLRTAMPEKVAQVKKSFTGKPEDKTAVEAGDIGIISGLSTVRTGDMLGSDHAVPPDMPLQVPLMTVCVEPENKDDFTRLAQALELLDLEDPRLNFRWYRDEQELHLDLMGYIQIEILQSMLQQRFGVKATFGEPAVIYRETPAASGYGFASYTMPKPCWAVVKFRIEPGAPGTGVQHWSEVSTDKIRQKYQNEITHTVPRALQQGIKGWEVTDIKVTLVDGEDHEIHSRPGDFIIATPMALMQGLMQTGTTLLEPVMDFVINAPEELLGKITGDLHKMRGSFGTPEFINGQFTLSGQVPAAISMDYGIRLGSLSGGKARVRFSLHGYCACPPGEGATRPYKGVNPLDTAKWILHARGAYRREEWGR